ncbi:MAG: hypothetical protein QM734_13840 [Cyclobacteriaceae bacterium]
MVVILIAGIDGDIDRSEIREAISQAKKRQKNPAEGLVELYQEIGEDFEDKLKVLLQSYPLEVTQRNPMVVDALTRLNDLLPKLNSAFSSHYYDSICDLAMKIKCLAVRWDVKSIGEAEARYVKIPMIKNPSPRDEWPRKSTIWKFGGAFRLVFLMWLSFTIEFFGY